MPNILSLQPEHARGILRIQKQESNLIYMYLILTIKDMIKISFKYISLAKIREIGKLDRGKALIKKGNFKYISNRHHNNRRNHYYMII